MHTWRLTKDVLTPWKWPHDQQQDYFLHVPMTIGGGVGAALGTYEGFRFSKKEYLPLNFLITSAGFCYGYVGGLFMGRVWPFTVPFLLARAYYPTADDDCKNTTTF